MMVCIFGSWFTHSLSFLPLFDIFEVWEQYHVSLHWTDARQSVFITKGECLLSRKSLWHLPAPLRKSSFWLDHPLHFVLKCVCVCVFTVWLFWPTLYIMSMGQLFLCLPKILPSTRDLIALNSVPDDRRTWLSAFSSTCTIVTWDANSQVDAIWLRRRQEAKENKRKMIK